MIHLTLMIAALLAQPSLQEYEAHFPTGNISSFGYNCMGSAPLISGIPSACLVEEEYTARGRMTTEEKYFYSVDAAGNESRPFSCTRETKPAAQWTCELRDTSGELMWTLKEGRSVFHNGATRKTVRRRLMFLRLVASGQSAEI